MIRRISSVATAAVVTLTAAGVWAQPAPGTFGASGQFAISAERLFGYAHTSHKVENEQAGQTFKQTTSTSQFSFLGAHGPSVYSHPRVGVDYFVIDRLSIGGSLIYMTRSAETETENPGQPTTTADEPTETVFIFGPRAGYAFMFNDMIGIWPRAGFTYYSTTSHQDTPQGEFKHDENGLAVTLEGMFVIAPIPHVGFLVGPTFDIGLTGGRDEQTPPNASAEPDAKLTDLALHAGLMVWF